MTRRLCILNAFCRQRWGLDRQSTGDGDKASQYPTLLGYRSSRSVRVGFGRLECVNVVILFERLDRIIG